MIGRRLWAKISGARGRRRRRRRTAVARDQPRPAAVRARNERTTRTPAHDPRIPRNTTLPTPIRPYDKLTYQIEI